MNRLHIYLATELELKLKKELGSAKAIKDEIMNRLHDDLYESLCDNDSGELAGDILEIYEKGWKFTPWNKMTAGELCLEYVKNNVAYILTKNNYNTEKEMLFENFENADDTDDNGDDLCTGEEISEGMK